MRRIDSLLAIVILVPIALLGLVFSLATCTTSPPLTPTPVVAQEATPCPTCPVPTPCPQLFPGGQMWVGASPRSAQALGVVQAQELYPVQRWEPVLEPLYGFSEEPPGIRVSSALAGASGAVRLALARPVANVLSPPRPGEADPEEWVLLAPCRQGRCVATWQEAISSAEAGGGGFGSLVIERRIGEVIPFRPDESSFQASLEALAPALLARREGATGGLWVEALLVRQCDGQCDVQWALYTFGNVPAPTDADRRRFYCCDWLGCGPAWRPECTVRCASVSCP